MIASPCLKVHLASGKDKLFPLYTQKTDFNRARAWLDFCIPFTIEGKQLTIYMRAITVDDTNYTGSSHCVSGYRPSTSTKRGLAIWITYPEDYLPCKIRCIAWYPETEKTKSQYKTSEVIIPSGFYAKKDRCYLLPLGIGQFDTNISEFYCCPPDFQFIHDDGSYDLLTYRGNYIVGTRSGSTLVYESGSTNPTSGSTTYYGRSDVNKSALSISISSGDTASQNVPLKNSSGYRSMTASGVYKNTTVDERVYERLYLPLVARTGSVAVQHRFVEGSCEYFYSVASYYNESFVTTSCSGTMDYSGTIECPKYGLDCQTQEYIDDIFGKGFYCSTGQDVKIEQCQSDTSCTGVSPQTITRCTTAACISLTETVGNIDEDCSIQTTFCDKVDHLPDDYRDWPLIDDWIDPNSCQIQTDAFGNYCEVDGPDSITCLGRVDQDGHILVDKNKIGDKQIRSEPCDALSCDAQKSFYYLDEETGKKYCAQVSSELYDIETGEIVGYQYANFAEVSDELDITHDRPADGMHFTIKGEYPGARIESFQNSDGSEVTIYIDRSYAPGITKLTTITDYPNDTRGITERWLDADGKTISVTTVDTNGNIDFCGTNGCSINEYYMDIYDNPTKEIACDSLNDVTVETYGVKQTSPSSSAQKDLEIQGLDTTHTTNATIDGHNITIGWTSDGVPINIDNGQVIDSTSTTDPETGQQTTVIETDSGNITTTTSLDSAGTTIMTTSYPNGTTSTTYIREDGVTVTVHPDGTTTAEWGDDVGNDQSATCWGGKSDGDICGGVNNPSSGYCDVGAGWHY